MKSWLPIILSFLIIAASTFIIKSHSQPLIPKTIVLITPTPTITTITPTPNPDDSYAKTYAKCGELPNLSDYSSTRFSGDYSPKMWSPSCRFIAWSATIKYSFGQWTVSKYEGLFLYDLKTQKTTRLYTPTSESDSVAFLRWLDNTRLIFHKSADNIDYIYNVTDQTVSKL
jgi:hypothetical protein